MKAPNLIYIALAALSVSCSQPNKPTTEAQDNTTQTTNAATAELKDSSTQAIYSNYIALKDALVSSDSVKAKSASASLASALKQVEGCEATSKIADSLSLSSDIKAQRQHFVLLSADIIPLIKHAPLTAGNIFIQHCPMANNGKGALWLASEKDIKNPYYGDEMLECGDVQEEIKAK